MKPSRIVSSLVLVAALGAGIWFQREGGLPLDPTELRERIASFGLIAPLGFVGIAALRLVFALPSFVIMTAGGLAFGVVGGTLLGSLGMFLGAVLVFGLARSLGRDAVQQRLGDRLARADEFLSRRGPKWLGAYTALPISFLTPVHAGAGLSSMPVGAFALWVSVGLVPRAALYSYFGDSFTRGTAAAVTAGVVVLVLGVVAIFVMRRMLRAEVPSASRSTDSTDSKASKGSKDSDDLRNPRPSDSLDDLRSGSSRVPGTDPEA